MRSRALTGTTVGSFDQLLVRNPANTGPYEDVLDLVSGAVSGGGYDDTQIQAAVAVNTATINNLSVSTANALNSKQDTIQDGDLTIAKTNGLQANLDSRATTTALTSGLATKQTIIGQGDLTISQVFDLQNALDLKASVASVTTGLSAKQNTIQDGDLSIAKTSGLQTALDSKATASALTSGLATKQTLIGQGDLTISQVFDLQNALDLKASVTSVTTGLAAKQNTIQDGDLSIAKTSGLQGALDSKATAIALTAGLATKQPVIGQGDLTISMTYDLQNALDLKASVVSVTNGLAAKQDTIADGDLTISKTNGLQAALDGKVDDSQVLTNVPQNAVFTDTVYTHPSSHPISFITGLQTELDSKATTSALTSGLAGKQDTLTTASIPQSYVVDLVADLAALQPQIYVNGSFVDQSKFSIENASLVLNLTLGIWQWKVEPTFSQIQVDAARLTQARIGALPLNPGTDCLAYFPMVTSRDDMGSGGLHWVITDISAVQGTWGVYKHAPANEDRYAAGWLKGTSSTSSYFIFPNRDVPNTQVTSRGIGWPSGNDDVWLIEYQVSLTSANSQLQFIWFNDADTDVNPADSIYCYLTLSAPAGTIKLFWDNRQGALGWMEVPVTIKIGEFQHVAMQKSSGSSDIRVYIDGDLKFTQAVPTMPPVIDKIVIHKLDALIVREFNARSYDPYPAVPFTPGNPVSFASAIDDTQRRWNSYML